MKHRKIFRESCILMLCLWAGYTVQGRQVSHPLRKADVAAFPAGKPAVSFAKLPLSFEANQGQTARSVKFLSHGRGYGLFLTGDAAVLALRTPLSVASAPMSWRGGNHDRLRRILDTFPQAPDAVLRMRLVGANANAVVTGRDELPGKVNYFLGNNPENWRTNVPTYAQVSYRNVYPGIELVYHGNQGGQLEYDFVVAPGADPSSILLTVDAMGGSNIQRRAAERCELKIDSNGDLIVYMDGHREVRFHKPLAFQPPAGSPLTTGHPSGIQARYVLTASNQVHFAVGQYDHTRPMVIDPVLVYSTYLGGSNADCAFGIAVDTSGSAYVTGYTSSTNFPVVNPLPAPPPSAINAFVAKINAAGSALVYSTYLGGSSQSWLLIGGSGIAVDSSGNAYVTGFTDSSDFPTTTGAFQTRLASTGGNAFVSKLNPTGSALVYSTYLGGNGIHSDPYYTNLTGDCGTGIAVDSSGSAYVTGYTHSTNFPTVNPLQASLPGAVDAFVTKLNAAGSALAYSTYLGGSNADYGYGVSVDASGNAYVTGQTNSTNFPTANPLQAHLLGSVNAFLTKLNAAGSALAYSTYLGGSDMDGGYGIAVDSSGSAYVAGTTYSNDFPTVNAFQATLLGTTAAFVAKLNAAGSALVYSTYLSGHVFDGSTGIAVNSSGSAYVTGYTHSTDFPTANPIQAGLGGTDTGFSDAFVTELDAGGSVLVFSTYLGGSSQDQGSGVAVDSSGNAYVTGSTSSTNFPTANPLQPSLGGTGAENAFVAKISAPLVPGVSFSSPNLAFGSQAVGTTSSVQSVTLTNSGPAPLTITGTSITGYFAFAPTGTSCPYSGGSVASQASCTLDITFTPAATGQVTGLVTVTDNDNGVAGSTQTIELTGTGAAAVVGLSPGSLTFSGQTAGTSSAAQPVTLSNTGNAPLTISSIGISGNFAQTNNCGGIVAANGSCTINVTFTPSASGTRTGILTVTDNSNGVAGSTQTVSLSGTGEDFTLATPSGSSSSQTVSPGQSATYTLSVGGEGGFNQAVTFTCTGAPSESTCTVSPNSVTVGSSATNITVTVATTAASVSLPRSRPNPPVPPLLPLQRNLVMFGVILAGSAWAVRGWRQSGRRGRRAALATLAAGLLLTLVMAACGGGGGSSGNGPTNPGTPAGTYNLTVTGTAGSGSNALSHSVALTLTVT